MSFFKKTIYLNKKIHRLDNDKKFDKAIYSIWEKMHIRWLVLIVLAGVLTSSISFGNDCIHFNWSIKAEAYEVYGSENNSLEINSNSINTEFKDFDFIAPRDGECSGEVKLACNRNCSTTGSARYVVYVGGVEKFKKMITWYSSFTENFRFDFFKYDICNFKVSASGFKRCSSEASVNFTISYNPKTDIKGSASGDGCIKKVEGDQALINYTITWINSTGGNITNVRTSSPWVSITDSRFEIWWPVLNSTSGTIMGKFINTQPSVTLVYPENDISIVDNTPLFSFSYNDPENDGQKAFQIQISTDNQFQIPNIFDSGRIQSNNTSYQLPSTDKLDSGTYYWRVRVSDIYDGDTKWGAFSEVSKFTNVAEPDMCVVDGDNVLANGDSYTFDDVDLVKTRTKTLSIKNNGSNVLRIDSINLDPQGVFFVIAPDIDLYPITIDPEQETELTLNFVPDDTGLHNTTVTIKSNDPDENPYLIVISGRSIDWVFRYKDYLFSKDGEYIKGKQSNISHYWGDEERTKAFQRVIDFKQKLKDNPLDNGKRGALLNVCYDIALAELSIAQEKVVESLLSSLGLNPQVSNEPIINQEISLLEESRQYYKKGLKVYFDLLQDSMGVDMKTVNSNLSSDIPFGYYVFSQEVPQRSLYSPLKRNAQGDFVLPNEIGDDVQTIKIFKGYKDLVLLLQIEKEYVRTTERLAQLYLLRVFSEGTNSPDESNSTYELIGNVLQASYLEVETLLSCFNTSLKSDSWENLPSVLTENINAWRTAMNALTHYQSYLEGETNPLGFHEDILVLFQSQIPGDPTTPYFNSYDFLSSYLMKESVGPLAVALSDFAAAEQDYQNYRDRQDQLAGQLTACRDQYDERLRKIVGVRYGETGYENPSENKGGEIALQNLNINRAVKRLESIHKEIDNVKEQINIEITRRGQQQNIRDSIRKVVIKYGEKGALIADRLADISVEQYYAANPLLNPYTVRSTWSIRYARLEKLKGFYHSQQNRLAATERAEISSLEDDLLNVDSIVTIKNMLLRIETLSLDIIDAAIQIEIEQGRLTALINEKADLEQRRVELKSELAGRYFADPAHRLLKDKSIIRAELSFKEAQRWMFLSLKALEYKWNHKFSNSYNDRNYSTKDIFILRNANELKDLFNAMSGFDTAMYIGERNDDRYKKFSIRDDFLGYNRNYERLRNYLNNNVLDKNDPENELSVKALKINFSTVKEASLFFNNRSWLEKINYIRIKILGGALNNLDSMVEGFLKYGGISYIRNMQSGTFDPQNPDQLIEEMTGYSVRYLYYEPNLKVWQNKDVLEGSIPVQFTKDPDVPSEIYQINTFKECSIATSEWSLFIALNEPDGRQIVDISKIYDIEIHFNFYSYNRN